MKRKRKLFVDIVMYALFLYIVSYQAGQGLLVQACGAVSCLGYSCSTIC